MEANKKKGKEVKLPIYYELAISTLARKYQPSSTPSGCEQLTTEEIREALSGVIPQIKDEDVIAILIKGGYCVNTNSSGYSFESRWMLHPIAY
jgi:hypothetical protein